MRMNGTRHVMEAMPFRLEQRFVMPSGRLAKLRYFDGERVAVRYLDDQSSALFTRSTFMQMLGKIQSANEERP